MTGIYDPRNITSVLNTFGHKAVYIELKFSKL